MNVNMHPRNDLIESECSRLGTLTVDGDSDTQGRPVAVDFDIELPSERRSDNHRRLYIRTWLSVELQAEPAAMRSLLIEAVARKQGKKNLSLVTVPPSRQG